MIPKEIEVEKQSIVVVIVTCAKELAVLDKAERQDIPLADLRTCMESPKWIEIARRLTSAGRTFSL